MKLRCDDKFEAYALLICSEKTKLDIYNSLSPNEKLSLIKLKPERDEEFISMVFYSDEKLYGDDLLLDYLNPGNLKLISDSLAAIVEKHEEMTKKKNYVRESNDDERATQASSNFLEVEEKKTSPKSKPRGKSELKRKKS